LQDVTATSVAGVDGAFMPPTKGTCQALVSTSLTYLLVEMIPTPTARCGCLPDLNSNYLGVIKSVIAVTKLSSMRSWAQLKAVHCDNAHD